MTNYPINTSTDSNPHLPTGAVSFSLAWDILWEQETFLSRLKYLIETVPNDKYHESHAFIAELLEAAEKDYESFAERVKEEKAKFGGNDVYVGKAVA